MDTKAREGTTWSFHLSLNGRSLLSGEPFTNAGPVLCHPFPSGTNVCAVANGGCQQLCLYRGGGQRACACAHGMLAEDGASCREYAGYLLYSERTILKSIHLSDERNLNAPVQPFEDPEHMKNVIALAFDYRAGTSPGTPNRIFFSDIHFGNIQQINDDGSGRITIVESKPNARLPRRWGRVGTVSKASASPPLRGSESHCPNCLAASQVTAPSWLPGSFSLFRVREALLPSALQGCPERPAVPLEKPSTHSRGYRHPAVRVSVP